MILGWLVVKVKIGQVTIEFGQVTVKLGQVTGNLGRFWVVPGR